MDVRTFKDSLLRIGARLTVHPRRGPVMFDPQAHIGVVRSGQHDSFRLRVHPLRLRAIEIRDVKPLTRRVLVTLHQRARSPRPIDRDSARSVSFLCGREAAGLFAHRIPDAADVHSAEAAEQRWAEYQAALRDLRERQHGQIVTSQPDNGLMSRI